MANGAILTAEQERKLRQPIDEYVGKIQKEIDELREHGTAECNRVPESYRKCKKKIRHSLKERKNLKLKNLKQS